MNPDANLSPAGLSLMPHQVEGVRWIAGRPGSLLAFDMGTGKTVIAVACLNSALGFKRALIICPASLKRNWYNETKKWLIDTSRTVGIAQGSYLPPTDVIIINYDILDRHKPALDSVIWDFIFVDEAHFCKSPKAKRTKCLIGGKTGGRSGVPYRPLHAHRKVALTGTPIVNQPSDIWPICNWLDPKSWPNLYWFEGRYCKFETKYFGRGKARVYAGAQHLDELNARLKGTIMLRKTKAQVLPDLPPKFRQVIEVDVLDSDANSVDGKSVGQLLKEEARLLAGMKSRIAALQAAIQLARVSGDEASYRQAIEQLADYYKGPEGEHVAVVRQKIALAKLPYVIDDIRNSLLDPTIKVLVGAHHRRILESIRDQLTAAGIGCVLLYGDLSEDERQSAVDRFQNDPAVRVFIGGFRAAGVGLNLTAASQVVFAEEDYVPSTITQFEDRCILEGQLVLTPSGWVPIESIVVGDFVIGSDGLPHPVLDAWSRDCQKPVVEVRVEGWPEWLRTTFDHRYLVGGSWVEAADLRVGNKVTSPMLAELDHLARLKLDIDRGKYARNGRKKLAPDDIGLTDEALFVFGYFVGDGFASVIPGKGRFVSFSGHKTKDADSFRRISYWFSQYGLSGYIREAAGLSMEMRFYSAEWAQWFSRQFGKYAEGKELPDWVWKLSVAQRKSLLSGLAASDGYNRGGVGRIEYVTASNKLASQVYRLAASCGHSVGIRKGSVASGQHNVVAWREGGTSGTILEIRHRFYKKNNGIRERVYDLTVEGSSDFVIGPAVVHNCHRKGQLNSVLVKHIVAHGSLDARIAKLAIAKQEVADRSIDGTIAAETPVDWIGDHRSAPTDDELSTPVSGNDVSASTYGLRRLVLNPREYGVSDQDLIIAERLSNRELTGRPAALARWLMKKYLEPKPPAGEPLA